MLSTLIIHGISEQEEEDYTWQINSLHTQIGKNEKVYKPLIFMK